MQAPTTSSWMQWRYSMHLFASLGELWLRRGDLSKAQGFVDQCLETALRTHSRKYVVKGQRLRGEISLSRRQWDEAESWLNQALDIAEVIGNPTQLWKTYFAIGRLNTEAKRAEPARLAYRSACGIIDQIKSVLNHPLLVDGLENSPLIQHVYDLKASHEAT